MQQGYYSLFRAFNQWDFGYNTVMPEKKPRRDFEGRKRVDEKGKTHFISQEWGNFLAELKQRANNVRDYEADNKLPLEFAERIAISEPGIEGVEKESALRAIWTEINRAKEKMSPRQSEVIDLLFEGKNNFEIAVELGITVDLVKIARDGAIRRLRYKNPRYRIITRMVAELFD